MHTSHSFYHKSIIYINTWEYTLWAVIVWRTRILRLKVTHNVLLTCSITWRSYTMSINYKQTMHRNITRLKWCPDASPNVISPNGISPNGAKRRITFELNRPDRPSPPPFYFLLTWRVMDCQVRVKDFMWRADNSTSCSVATRITNLI